jgi:hypothetical protein
MELRGSTGGDRDSKSKSGMPGVKSSEACGARHTSGVGELIGKTAFSKIG